MAIHRIDELGDPLLDDYRELKDATRRRSGTFIAESELVVTRLLQSRFVTRSMLMTEQRYTRLAEVVPSNVDVLIAQPEVIDEVIGFPLHRGVVALGVRPAVEPAWREICHSARTLVVMEDVVDPDNIGAVFRHSAAFGVDGVLLSPNNGDPLYRKAIRAAVGWSLHVPWARLDDRSWPSATTHLASDGWHVIALTPDSKGSLLPEVVAQAGPSARIVFLVGSEHLGLTDQAFAAATHRARIPMAPGVDSLNVATTVALSLYERFRSTWSE
jgi:tRNA G18 (ribose-2'-O)-methylase SpoU